MFKPNLSGSNYPCLEQLPSIARVLVCPPLDSLEAVEGTCDQRRLWSDCVDTQADLSLRWSHKTYCRFCRALALTLSREINVRIAFPFFWKRVYSERKECAPIRSKFFSFRVVCLSEGAWYTGKQTGSHNRCHTCKQWRKIYQVYTYP